MKNLHLRTFDLSLDKDFDEFLTYKKDFLNIMSLSYGENYWSDEIYENKIKKRCLIVSILFSGKELIPIGSIIIKRSGKLSGIAVIKKYRRRGFAKYMIEKMIHQFPNIFVEVAIENKFMRKLLSQKKFKPVEEIDEILNLLNNEKVQKLKKENNYVVYYHGERCNVDRLRKFVMYKFKKSNIKS
ncbi:MAG: GNAT family N-acetyltransferase [Desulfobulbaceae bacterium]|nr:GNAT family N-acetyltransferase [Desulfobulbaceae bacterium]HIJ80005.1 GNAT family N-acetyltransferase [Deltaproteobacteria bacterium]